MRILLEKSLIRPPESELVSITAFLTCASPSTAWITGVQTRFLGTTDLSGSCHSPEQVRSFLPANGFLRLTIFPLPFYSYAA